MALGDGHHKAQVCLAQLLAGEGIPLLDALRQADLLFCRQQINTADLAQIHPHGIVNCRIVRLDGSCRGRRIGNTYLLGAQGVHQLLKFIGVQLQCIGMAGDLLHGQHPFAAADGAQRVQL